MLLAISGFVFSFLLGSIYPRRMGWIVISTFPILYAMYAMLIPSTFFPLTAVRFAFAVTIGILFVSLKNDVRMSLLLKSKFVILLIIFIIYTSFLKSNENLFSLFGSYIPGFFVSITLPFMLIQNKYDLQKLVKIFAWQGAIIGFFVAIEYISEYNPYDFFVGLNKSIGQKVNYEEVILYRGGFKRVAGLAGNAVDTGYLLAFYFPVSLWLLQMKGKINKIPIFLIAVGIILLQTRATFIALGVALFVMLLYINVYNKGNKFNSRRLIGQIISFFLISTILTIIIFPGVFNILSNFFSGMFSETGGFGIDSKILRIPMAIAHFLENPMGSGSPSYVYYVIMRSDDLPAPMIYFLAGGFILGIVYLLLLLTLVMSVFRILSRQQIVGNEKIFIIMMGCALLTASIVVFSNWREKH